MKERESNILYNGNFLNRKNDSTYKDNLKFSLYFYVMPMKK